MKHYINDWVESQQRLLREQPQIPPMGGDPGQMMGPGGAPPTSDPNAGALGNIGNPMGGDPNITNPPSPDMTQGPTDISSDPESPDMPEQKEDRDFESWKNEYFKASIKGNVNDMLEMIGEFRDREGLEPYQEKFIEDNYNVMLVRQNANVLKASENIRKLVKDQLDRNNPGTSVVNHITSVLESEPMLNNIYIKTTGYQSAKGDLHRKYISALLGAVQVGAGANNEDIIFNDREYSIMISTRFNSEWGEVFIGNWSLKEDDPERFLAQPELKKLHDGAPEEREVFRRRIVIESIAKQFETRAFLINVVGEDGTIYYFGWDVANSLRSAYADGKLVVRTKLSDNSEAMIDDEGNIVPLVDMYVYYTKESGEQGPDGMPEKEELEFLTRKKGQLFLTANMQTLKEAAASMPGAIFKEVPYRGNPSDLKELKRCVFTAHDMLLRTC